MHAIYFEELQRGIVDIPKSGRPDDYILTFFHLFKFGSCIHSIVLINFQGGFAFLVSLNIFLFVAFHFVLVLSIVMI